MKITRGYYYVASQRLADNLAQTVCYDLLTLTRDNMMQYLVETLRLAEKDANDRCRRLLEIDQDIVLARQNVEDELRSLLEAQEMLKNIGMQDLEDMRFEGEDVNVDVEV